MMLIGSMGYATFSNFLSLLLSCFMLFPLTVVPQGEHLHTWMFGSEQTLSFPNN